MRRLPLSSATAEAGMQARRPARNEAMHGTHDDHHPFGLATETTTGRKLPEHPAATPVQAAYSY
ncbi:UNVERIFIED_ORG: hypothetical protein ABIB52_004349 [Arthrobacter sp. UYCu721]